MDELKPCPFCGQTVAELSSVCDDEICGNFEDEELCPAYEPGGSCGGVYIVCNKCKGGCGSSTGWYRNRTDAVIAWNTRVTDILTEGL